MNLFMLLNYKYFSIKIIVDNQINKTKLKVKILKTTT